MRRIIETTLLIGVLFAAGQAFAQSQGQAPGREAYESLCSRCHQMSGEPVAAIARAMRVEMRHLGSAEVQAKSDEQLSKDTTEGVGKMRPVRDLSDEDVANLILFVRSLAETD